MQVEGDRPELNIDWVIFATDFSRCTENAGLYAQQLARYYSATLAVTHAFYPSQAAAEAEAISHNLSRERERLFNQLSEAAAALRTEGLEVNQVLLEGNTASMIADLADRYAPSLIVLGTEGRGRVQRELLGSAAEKILRSTPWPCVVVGPNVPRASHRAVPFRRILYATDFTPAAAHAAIYAMTLASEAGARIDVLNVAPSKAIEHPERLAELEKHFFDELDRLVPAQAREFSNPRTFVDVGDAHRRIQEHILQHQVDLLVIGVRKSSFLDLEMRTSNAFALVIESPCPVLTLRG